MGKIKDLVIDVDLSDELNVNETKHNVLNLFEKYRNYKFMENAIIARRSSSLNFDNLGIYNNTPGDPTCNKVEQQKGKQFIAKVEIMKYKDFTDTVDSVYKEFCYQLTQEEKIIYKKTLISNHKDDDVLEELSMTNRNTYFNLKQKCYIKVAMWFNLEVYKN